MRKEAKREWKVDFKMIETETSEHEDVHTTQREIAHAIGRAIGSLTAQYEGLKVVDYHTLYNDREQPEAEYLKPTKKLPNQ